MTDRTAVQERESQELCKCSGKNCTKHTESLIQIRENQKNKQKYCCINKKDGVIVKKNKKYIENIVKM